MGLYSSRDFDHSSSDQLVICCPECECPLTLHQPDSDLPNRLLATCDDCKAWFLTDGRTHSLIPLAQYFRDQPQTS